MHPSGFFFLSWRRRVVRQRPSGGAIFRQLAAMIVSGLWEVRIVGERKY
jgi:hypothetical protein